MSTAKRTRALHSVKLTVMLRPAEHAQLMRHAQARDVTASAVVRYWIREIVGQAESAGRKVQ